MKRPMLRRFMTSILLVVFALPGPIVGGPFYFLVAGFFLVVAAWAYVDMSRATGVHPSRPLVVGGVFVIIAARAFRPDIAMALSVFSILLAMSIHLIEYERGHEQAALDLWASVGGLAYLGWVGAYLIDLRSLPNGGWWFLLALPLVWLADTSAYAIGTRFGAHKMAPRLSPGKSWEGYWAGAISGALGGGALAYLYSTYGPLQLPVWQGVVFGLLIGLLTPLGDFGESMLKRQAGMKDSGNLFPGHGGAFDRIDSWLWAAVLG